MVDRAFSRRVWKRKTTPSPWRTTGVSRSKLRRRLDYDVIVLDLMLPGMSGYEVAQRLRKIGNRIPILTLIARDMVPDVVKGP